MANDLDLVNTTIDALEKAVPLIVSPSYSQDAVQFVQDAAEAIGQISFDKSMKSLATTIKILNGGESPILKTVTYQNFVLDMLEMFSKIREQMQAGNADGSGAKDMQTIGEFLIRIAGRATNRFKLQITFDPEYEAKYLRAFMLLRELKGVVRFLNLNPDISMNQNANLDAGLEVDILSQATPQELHKIAGSVLDVQSVQVYTETKATPVMILDPPSNPESFDTKVNDFLA